jgi:hypothetical protein
LLGLCVLTALTLKLFFYSCDFGFPQFLLSHKDLRYLFASRAKFVVP